MLLNSSSDTARVSFMFTHKFTHMSSFRVASNNFAQTINLSKIGNENLTEGCSTQKL